MKSKEIRIQIFRFKKMMIAMGVSDGYGEMVDLLSHFLYATRSIVNLTSFLCLSVMSTSIPAKTSEPNNVNVTTFSLLIKIRYKFQRENDEEEWAEQG